MPEFKKGNDWSNKFLSKSPWKKETRWEGPYKKTIAKDPTIDEDLAKETRLEGSRGKKVTKTKSRDDWEPAWEGADIGKKEWNNMTKKQQGEYTEKYGD